MERQFENYLLALGDEVYRYLVSKGASREDAEDIIQNTYYKLLSMINELDHSYIRAWFYRVALNNYTDLQRKKQRHAHALTEHQLRLLSNSQNELDEFLNRDEIIVALRNIKSEYRELFVLKYYYDLTYEEIGQLLNLSLAAVKQRMYRARKFIHNESRGLRTWISQLKRR